MNTLGAKPSIHKVEVLGGEVCENNALVRYFYTFSLLSPS